LVFNSLNSRITYVLCARPPVVNAHYARYIPA